jgi:hypothetical protein
MEKQLSIVKVDRRNYRIIAKENWGLTKEQMRGMHVHHRIKRCEGGTDDPSNLYVCSEWFHDNVWHSGDGGFAGLSSKAAEKGRQNRPAGMNAELGKKMSEWVKENRTPEEVLEISKRAAESSASDRRKPVVATHLETGYEVVFPSARAAAKGSNVSWGYFNRMLNGEFKSAKGYSARYCS